MRQWVCQRRHLLLGVLLSVTAIFIFFASYSPFTASKRQFVREPGVKYVLLWNKYWELPNFGFSTSEGTRVFEEAGCQVSACVMTKDRSLMPVEEFDAVAFHMYHFHVSSWSFLHGGDVPSKRRPEQRYIFFTVESPFYGENQLNEMASFFNWTMTYRRDSDILRPYGEVVALPGAVVPARGWALPPSVPISPHYVASNSSDAGAGRVAQVAWLVSHCSTQSRREVLVQRLAQHVEHVHVDTFGDCSKSPWPKDDREGFYRMLPQRYHFYLSFENSLCRDYVTEKFFDVLSLDVIPVVYGGANYSAVAPPYSYIDARAFSSERDLAVYLQYLVFHPKEYNKFFWWKKFYFVEKRRFNSRCKLCQMLHEEQPAFSYPDIQQWWQGEGTCQEPVFSS